MQERTVADLAAEHLAYLERRVATKKLKPSTLRLARSLYKTAILRRLRGVKLSELTERRLEEWHSRIARTTPVRANRAAELLRAGWRLAVRWEWTDKPNPLAFLREFRAPEKAPRVILTVDELARLKAELRRQVTGASLWTQGIAALAILLLIETGCRREEIFGLAWEEVDLERRCLHLADTKTGPSLRLLSDAAIEIIKLIPKVPGEKKCFPHATPKRIWPKVKKNAGVPHATLQSLRRTFSSRLADRGVAPEDVAALLGQKSIRVNVEHYRVLGSDRLRNLANQAAEALR